MDSAHTLSGTFLPTLVFSSFKEFSLNLPHLTGEVAYLTRTFGPQSSSQKLSLSFERQQVLLLLASFIVFVTLAFCRALNLIS